MRKLVLAACAAFVFTTHSANAQSLQDQQMCAAQAQKVENEVRDNDSMDDSISATHISRSLSHESYYNPNLNVCFVLMSENSYNYTNFIDDQYKRLQDAFGKHIYGVYEISSTKGTSQYIVDQCWVNVTGQRQECHSKDEFTSLITPYFHK
jgi:hypothetical protein